MRRVLDWLVLGDTDPDGDGLPTVDDNCPDDYNPDQLDTDGDGAGDVCDSDDDDDGVADTDDICGSEDSSLDAAVFPPMGGNPGAQEIDSICLL